MKAQRQIWLLLHRYLGLAMTVFLILVSLTGSVLAFYNELDRWLNPELLTVPVRDAPLLDPFELRTRAEASDLRIRVNVVKFNRSPGESYAVLVEPKIDPATGEPYRLPYSEAFFDPVTGTQIGTRVQITDWNQAASLDKTNILLFLYALHERLALPPDALEAFGYVLMGSVALCWIFDGVVGLYLTLPVRRTSESRRSWWARWKPAWLVKWGSATYRLNFDLHRAAGLWTWAMLLILACSSVSFNLFEEVYFPLMKRVFTMPAFTAFGGTARAADAETSSARPPADATLDWHAAYVQGRQHLEALGRQHGFHIVYEEDLSFESEQATYLFRAHTSTDWGRSNPRMTFIRFDANTGALTQVFTPNAMDAGDTITLWLAFLHRADVFGLPMQAFVCAMGFVITALSITGVYIWWKKRRSRIVAASRRGECR